MTTKKTNDKPDLMIRAATVEMFRAEGAQEDSLRMSVSSDAPVLTSVYFNGEWQRAYEILDHAPASIDMSRCKDGLVVLDRHYGDQVALIPSPELRDGKLGGIVNFCTGTRAKEIAADAAKGLRRNVSVGYAVDTASYRLEGEQNGIPVVRATRWTPYEASFVPVPADTTVGVSRAAKETAVKPATTEERNMDAKVIAEMYRLATAHGIAVDDVQKLVDEGKGVDEVRALVISKQSAEIAGLKTAKPKAHEQGTEAKLIGGSREEQAKILKRYSVVNVIRALAGQPVDIGFEREMSAECARLSQKAATGIIIPHAVLGQRDFTKLGTSSASVATDLLASEFIDLLRSKNILGALGVKYLSGLVGDVAIPKMTAGATGYWVAESGDITESAPTLGQVTGSPHTCGAMVDISRRLLIQSTPSAEMMVRDEIIERLARTLQIAVFAGTGADGQPSAITNATGINNPSVTQGTPTYAELLNFPGSIMADNAEADGQKWAMTAEVWAKLAATMRTATYGDIPVLDPVAKNCIGFPYLTSEDLPANSLWFGNWSTVVIGLWGNGIDINVDTATLSSSGGVRLVGLQDVDVMVRQGAALAYNTAVTS